MFDPFFTPKEAGQGTGLGLSLCYNFVVKEHKGKIRVRTRKGIGTNFVISLRVDGASSSALDAEDGTPVKASFG